MKYEKQQIAAFLEALSKSAAAQDRPECSSRFDPRYTEKAREVTKQIAFFPILVIVGLQDTKIGKDVIAEADKKNIAVYRAIACKIKVANSVNIQVGPAIPVNDYIYSKQPPPGKLRWTIKNLFGASKIGTIYPQQK